jgi:hypothetical protein
MRDTQSAKRCALAETYWRFWRPDQSSLAALSEFTVLYRLAAACGRGSRGRTSDNSPCADTKSNRTRTNLVPLGINLRGMESSGPHSTGILGLGFVSNGFEPTLDDAFEHGILPGVQDCGFRTVRLDMEHFGEEPATELSPRLDGRSL